MNKKLGAIELSSDILEKSNIGLWAFELDEGKPPRMYVDTTMLGLIGLTEQKSPEETYHAWYDHIDKEHYDEVSSAVEKMTAGIHAEVQYPWHHPDGKTMFVRCGGVRNFAYKTGIRIEGCHQDVTNIAHFQKLGTVALSSDIFNKAKIGFWAFELDEGKEPRMYVNNIMLGLIGLTEQKSPEETYHAWYDHIDKEHYDEVTATVEKMTAGIHAEVQYTWHHPNGKTLYVRCGGVRNYAYKTGIRIEGCHQDITEMMHFQKKTEEDLKQYSEIANSLSESFENVYYVNLSDNSYSEFNTHRNFHNLDITLNGKDFFAESLENIKKVVYPEDLKLIADYITRDNLIRGTEDNKIATLQYRLIINGKPLYHRIRTARSIIDNSHLIVAVENVDSAVRENMEREKALEHAYKVAESASKAKTEFLFNVSHDIRTPMNAIIGYVGIAKKNISNEEKLSSTLDKITSSSNQLLNLIDDVLEMSRIESCKIEIEEKPVSCAESHRILLDIIKPMIDAKNIRFIQHDDGKTDNLIVWADELRFHRVLLNILTNAVKYTPSGGTIYYTVSTRPSQNEGHIIRHYEIRDTGIGMSEEFLKHVYEAFAREKTSTVSRQQGTGLGLAITKNLIELMNGTIEIESKLNEGTKVTLEFDFRIADEDLLNSELAGEKSDTINFNGKKLLLVEDNEMNREIAQDILQEAGFEIDTAEDGSVALERMKSVKPGTYDIILMDIQMPVMDGYEATKAIRSLNKPGISDIPIIALSANAFEEDRQKSISIGMNDHVAKPIDVPKLKKAILNCMRT